MCVSLEELKSIEALGLRKHVQIVDGYIATGLDLDDITIHYAVEQDKIALVLHGYGFGIGSLFGDKIDSKKAYKGIPFHMVEEFVTAYFPGFAAEDPNGAVTLDSYLDAVYPEWRNRLTNSKSTMFRISQDELRGDNYYKTGVGKKKESVNDYHKKSFLGILRNITGTAHKNEE